MIDFTWIYQLKGLKPKNKDDTNFYECCDLTEKVYILYLYLISYFSFSSFFQYWNRTGQLRPTTGPARKDGSKGGGIQKYNSLMKNNGKPPKGMYVNHDDLVSLATGPSTQGEQLLKGMDREIVSFKRIVSKIFFF